MAGDSVGPCKEETTLGKCSKLTRRHVVYVKPGDHISRPVNPKNSQARIPRTQRQSHTYFPVVAAILIMFSMGSLYTWSVFVQPLENDLRISRSQTSLVFSLAVVSFTILMLCGPHIHRYLRVTTITMLTFGLAATGSALAGWGSSIWTIALGYGGLFGAANGLGYGLSIQLVHVAMPNRRGLATGLAVASYTLGAAVLAPLFATSIQDFGVPWTFIVTAILMVVIGTTSVFMLRASRTRLANPSLSGEIGSGSYRRHMFLKLWLGFFLGSLAGMMTLGHAAAMAASFGATAKQIATAASLVAIGNGVGRLAGGWLCDHIKPRLILSVMQVLAGLALLALTQAPSVNMVMIALTVVGLGYGCMAGAYPVVISHLYGINNVSRVYGRVFTAWGVAGMGAPYLAGLLFDAKGDYQMSIALAGASALCAAFICYALTDTRAEPEQA